MTPMPPLVVGEAPNAAGATAYDTASGLRLQKLCGVALPWMNLLSWTPSKGWPAQAARGHARHLVESYYSTTGVLLLLGARVCNAFDLPRDREWLEWYRSPEHSHPMIAVPHPSGLNRWWNDEDNARQAEKLLGAVARLELPDYRGPVPKEDE